MAAATAARWNPLDPEPWAVRGALLLATGREQQDRELLRQAGEAFSLAISLDPQRAFFHDRLSVIHMGLEQRLPAFFEADRAWRLYPLAPRYQDRRQALLQIVGGGS